jgi:hypothetical protein
MKGTDDDEKNAPRINGDPRCAFYVAVHGSGEGGETVV